MTKRFGFLPDVSVDHCIGFCFPWRERIDNLRLPGGSEDFDLMEG